MGEPILKEREGEDDLNLIPFLSPGEGKGLDGREGKRK